PPDTIADVREPPGPHPAAFLLWNPARACEMGASAICGEARCGAVVQQVRHAAEGLSHDLDSGNPLCYRTGLFWSGGIFGRIAQLVEQLTLNQRVPGSSPGAPTNKIKDLSQSDF